MDVAVVVSISAASISLLSFFFAQYRANRAEQFAERTDSRAAAKETVYLLHARLNTQQDEIKDLRDRLRDCEVHYHNCEEERNRLLTHNYDLMSRALKLDEAVKKGEENGNT